LRPGAVWMLSIHPAPKTIPLSRTTARSPDKMKRLFGTVVSQDVADAQLVWIRRRAMCHSGQAQQAPAAGECADQSHHGGVPHRQPGTRQLPCVTARVFDLHLKRTAEAV
jgi:hypothetical protein